MQKLRVSYSLLDIFSKGRVDDAVRMYLRLPGFTSPALEDGKLYHKRWEEEIMATKTIRIGRTVFNLKNPRTEEKHLIPYNKWWDLSGVIDCVDGDSFYEFKTGKSTSLDYASSYQVPFYFLMYDLLKKPKKQAFIIHYNQHTKEGDVMKLWGGEMMLERAKNFIDTIAPDVYDYFKNAGLLDNKDR